jgi:hypothetical protein
MPAYPPQGQRTTIEFPFFSSISEPLWSGSIYVRSDNGLFEQIERPTVTKDSDTEATVTIDLFDFNKREEVPTLTPFGFCVLDIKEVTSEGVDVPFRFDPQRRSITLLAGDGSQDATIKYRVTSAKELVALPLPVDHNIFCPDFNNRLSLPYGSTIQEQRKRWT